MHGKNVPFSISNCPKILKGIRYQYEYRVNVHNCTFKNASFYDVRYRSGHITKSSFELATLENVDFISINLNRSKFVNSQLSHVIFFSCNLTNADFKNARFNDVYFISCKMKNLKNIKVNDEVHIIKQYDKYRVSSYLEYKILFMHNILKFEKYNIITTSTGKINYWMLRLLLKDFSEDKLSIFFHRLILHHHHQFFTINDYKGSLQSFYKK